MRVRELVGDRKVVQIDPRSTALEAARLMAKAEVGALLVTDSGGAILGIFTERDLMVRVVAADRLPGSTPIEEVMTRKVFTTSPDAAVLDLRSELKQRHIRHVPVIEDGNVISVLSMRDLVRAALEETLEDTARLTDYIRGEPA